MLRRRFVLPLLASSLATAACADTVGVRVTDILGTYEATILVAEGQAVLAAGGSLSLTFEGKRAHVGVIDGTCCTASPTVTVRMERS